MALAGYWYWSPHLAIRQMQAAIQAGDAQAFNEHVDYPRIRDSLKGQLSAMMADKLGGNPGNNPFAALGSMLGLAMVDTMVDAMVRPDMVMLGMRTGKFAPPVAKDPGAPSGAPPQDSAAPAPWVYERKNLDKLIAYRRGSGPADDKGVGLVFERSSFANWKLTEIRMPVAK